MKIIVVAHDLIPEKWHLMPWRTAVEVVNGLCEQGHDAILVSLDNSETDIQNIECDVLPAGTLRISKCKYLLEGQLGSVVRSHQAELIFWPVTWREPRWRVNVVACQNVSIVGWFPGGVYTWSDAIYGMRKLGLRKALPYLVEAFYPKKIQMRYMKEKGLNALLAMTSLTARVACENGWPNDEMFVVPPAKEKVSDVIEVVNDDVNKWLGGGSFILFMGPPNAIRGINEVLDAFEMVASQSDEIRLICLFRGDGRLDRDIISKKIKAMAAFDRIYVTWESLPKARLNGFIDACHAVVMPFIFVPSEIPLAIIESIAFGKPVLTTQCGGTGEFVKEFGSSTRIGDVRALSDAMLKIINDKLYYESCSKSASDAFLKHPQWADVAAEWGYIAEKITGKLN